PMLENPECLRAMVKETGAFNTDYQSPESVDDLCDKTTPYANTWKETADEIWEANPKSKVKRERKR
ncbi:MAG: radical SAM protein, partial [Lachnospiraceae bacterium]|nr:radical SAM protein [Lachnospiraceae bacterium]